MQNFVSQPVVSIDEVIVRGSVAARRIADELAWGEGAIQPQSAYANPDAQRELVNAVLDSIETVSNTELAYSACTDGRLPLKLASDELIPVREQLVGADTVSAFYVAECLGARFYANPDAPVRNRVLEVAEFLRENGLLPSSHVACGAADGFVTITKNVLRFNRNKQYQRRLQALLPEGVFDEGLHEQMLQASQVRLQKGVYAGLSAQTFLDVVEAVSGKHAIALLQDDGRGVHGHTEEAIMRLHLPGKAINEAKVTAATGAREVFGVNDNRMERLSRLFARGNDQDYRIAAMALEDFASSGHGTLAKYLPTYLITAA